MTKKIMLVCMVLAFISALIYVLMAQGIMHAGDLSPGDEGLPPYFYIVPGGYVLGGLLILVKKRWLWITGAVINGFGVAMFYYAYYAKTEIMLSAPGLITKVAQILMEIGLIYLIVTYKRKKTGSGA
jgi:hypothetical protein